MRIKVAKVYPNGAYRDQWKQSNGFFYYINDQGHSSCQYKRSRKLWQVKHPQNLWNSGSAFIPSVRAVRRTRLEPHIMSASPPQRTVMYKRGYWDVSQSTFRELSCLQLYIRCTDFWHQFTAVKRLWQWAVATVWKTVRLPATVKNCLQSDNIRLVLREHFSLVDCFCITKEDS